MSFSSEAVSVSGWTGKVRKQEGGETTQCRPSEGRCSAVRIAPRLKGGGCRALL